MSSLGVFSDECSTFLDMMNDMGIDKKQQLYIIKKMINIIYKIINKKIINKICPSFYFAYDL